MDERLQQLRDAQQAATTARMRAEMELDAARGSLQSVKEALEAIGITDVLDAEVKIAQWEAQLSELLATAEQKIEESCR